MDVKDKAKELHTKFYWNIYVSHEEAKKCALICVDEIINNVAFYDHKTKKEFLETSDYSDNYFTTFWIDVRKELEKL